ncbi:PadR family transcriptional regulator [Microbacterium sp. NPDC055683]
MAEEMREPTFLILAALAGGRAHGYALMREAETLSAGRVRLKVGTLYAALDRLAGEGLVDGDGEEVLDGRLRRYYRLTDGGAARLEEEATRRASMADEAHRRLRSRGVASKPVVA